MTLLRSVALTVCGFFLPVTLLAQAPTGSIAGVVRDTSGAFLPGVTVEAASPALIEQARTAVTHARGVIGALVPEADVVCLTRSRHERAAAPSDLEPLVRSAAPGATLGSYDDVPTALGAAMAAARAGDLVLVTGSLFVVGEALVWWRHSSR